MDIRTYRQTDRHRDTETETQRQTCVYLDLDMEMWIFVVVVAASLCLHGGVLSPTHQSLRFFNLCVASQATH